jgi:hypothetical protein
VRDKSVEFGREVPGGTVLRTWGEGAVSEGHVPVTWGEVPLVRDTSPVGLQGAKKRCITSPSGLGRGAASEGHKSWTLGRGVSEGHKSSDLPRRKPEDKSTGGLMRCR